MEAGGGVGDKMFHHDLMLLEIGIGQVDYGDTDDGLHWRQRVQPQPVNEWLRPVLSP